MESRKQTLREITDDMLTVIDMANDPDVDQEVLSCTLEAIQMSFEDKCDSIAHVLSIQDSDETFLTNEIERLTAKRESIRKGKVRLKNYLQDAMQRTGNTKFKTQLYSFGIQNNAASVIIDDPTSIPKEYLIPQEPKVDKVAIKNRLKNGEFVNWAHLEQGQSLRIR